VDAHAAPTPRRPLKTRGRRAPQALAAALARAGVRPNHVSLASIAFAGAAAAALAALPHVGTWLQALLLGMAAAGIQLRLLCNLVDGLLAVEGGLATRSGELWNDVPDRVADVALLTAAGYAAGSTELGLAASLAAVLTAYARVLAGAVGATQRFSGPMAKQHRMAVLTAACLLSLVELAFGFEGDALLAALVLILVGSLVTFVRRLRATAAELEQT
jgi:phosphatidylglycerophosphate synthase